MAIEIEEAVLGVEGTIFQFTALCKTARQGWSGYPWLLAIFS